MIKQDGYWNACGQKLRTRENDTSVLLVCINPRCDNYWINQGSEIMMVLK